MISIEKQYLTKIREFRHKVHTASHSPTDDCFRIPFILSGIFYFNKGV